MKAQSFIIFIARLATMQEIRDIRNRDIEISIHY